MRIIYILSTDVYPNIQASRRGKHICRPMVAANNLDGSSPPAHAPPPAMKKIQKKKSTKTTAASSVRCQRPTVESLLIEAVDLLGIMLKDRQQNNSRRRKRRNAECSVDRERRRAYKIEAKKRAKIEAKKRAKIEAKATRDTLGTLRITGIHSL
jgi:hypothetical protein